jgi:hypothetical protein
MKVLIYGHIVVSGKVEYKALQHSAGLRKVSRGDGVEGTEG